MTDNPPDKVKRGKGAIRILEAVILLALVGVAAVALTSGPSHTVTASAGPTTASTTPQHAVSPATTATPSTSASTSPTTVTTPTTSKPRVKTKVKVRTRTTPTTVAHPLLVVGPTTTQVISSPPIAVPGGSFRVTGSNVSLTHVVVTGDTLFGIAGWYKLMGGETALYSWNHSTVGNNPNLIFPGEVLTITVPQQDIPKISPVYLAETVQGSRK